MPIAAQREKENFLSLLYSFLLSAFSLSLAPFATATLQQEEEKEDPVCWWLQKNASSRTISQVVVVVIAITTTTTIGHFTTAFGDDQQQQQKGEKDWTAQRRYRSADKSAPLIVSEHGRVWKKCEEKKVENGFVLFLLLVCLLVGFYHNGGGGVSEFIACKDTRTHINTLTYRNGWRKCVGCRLGNLSLLMLF